MEIATRIFQRVGGTGEDEAGKENPRCDFVRKNWEKGEGEDEVPERGAEGGGP